MTLRGIFTYIENLRESIDSHLAIGNPDKAANLLKELEEARQKYEISADRRDYRLAQRVKKARKSKFKIRGPFDYEIYIQEWLVANNRPDGMKHYGLSLHTTKEKMLKTPQEIRPF